MLLAPEPAQLQRDGPAAMEFLHSHHSTNSHSESPYTIGAGSVGSIEASIPAGLCSGSLGADDEADQEVDEHHQQQHQQSDPSLGGLRLQDLHSPGDDDTNASAQQQQVQVHQIQLNGVQGSVQGQLVGEFGTSFWVDDMAGFPLPPLDLDPLAPGLFSPCSATYNWGCARGECMPRPGNINGEGMADVLLSLKHAVVHPGSPTGAGYYSTGSAPAHHAYATAQDYGQSFGPGAATVAANHYPQGPAMSVNVSMNMTMNMNMHPGHGYEQSYSGAWGVEPLLSPAPQYAGVEQTQPQPQQRVAQPTNGLASAQQHHPQHQQQHHQQPQQQQQQQQTQHNGLQHEMCGVVGLGLAGSDDQARPNLCRICGKTYARPSTLKTHLRTHSGEKPFRCHACSKAFSQAANLTAHARTHSGEKPFRCPVCDRRFSQSSSVTTHMRTHSGERPYRCRFCKKAFSDSSTLTKHLRIHSGEKPYQCKLCLLRFSQSGNLNRHMRVHGGSLT